MTVETPTRPGTITPVITPDWKPYNPPAPEPLAPERVKSPCEKIAELYEAIWGRDKEDTCEVCFERQATHTEIVAGENFRVCDFKGCTDYMNEVRERYNGKA